MKDLAATNTAKAAMEIMCMKSPAVPNGEVEIRPRLVAARGSSAAAQTSMKRDSCSLKDPRFLPFKASLANMMLANTIPITV